MSSGVYNDSNDWTAREQVTKGTFGFGWSFAQGAGLQDCFLGYRGIEDVV
jgi:hypothetical protein